MKKNYIFTLLLVFYFSNLSFGQGSEVFTNSTATNSYADGSFVGEGDITWTFVKSRQASGNFNDTDITSMDLPALMLRRASDDSKITSNTISGGLADFSVKMYKGFTGGGNRQVELFVNGESKGTSEVFDDYTEHVFAVTGVNIAGDVVIELKNTTEKQVIIDEITWTAYTAVVSNQVVLEDFETTLPAGAIVADGTEAPTVVADPAANNTNGDVMKIVTSTAGDAWQNAQLFFQDEDLDLTTTDKVVTVDVYSDVATFILAKTASGLNGGAESATDASHGGTGWETLSFDFNDPKDNTAAANGVFGRILFFPLWNGAGWDPAAVTTTHYDNIKGIGYTPPVVYDLLEDFETTLPAGAIVADGTEAPTVVADPAANNTNGDVMKIVTSTAGDAWQNAQLFFQDEDLDLTTTDKVVTVDVYSDVATFILAKTASGLNGGAESATDASHGGTGWETLTFDFSVPKDNTAAANGVFGRILFFPLWNGAGWDPAAVTTTYYDNIKGIGYTGTPPEDPAPTDAPTTPIARNDWDVISIYSDAYASTGLTDVTWDEGSLSTEVTIASNNVLKVDFINFLGTELSGGGVDATDMTHFHMDYWVADDFAAGQVFNPKLSNHAASAGETGAKLYTVALGAEDNKKWLSLDVELGTDFERNNILQFLLTTSATVKVGYIDNIYMYRAATASVGNNELLNISMYPNPVSDRLNISAQSTIKSAAIYNLLGKKVMSLEINKNSESINVSGLDSGMYLIKYSLDNAIGTAKFIKQ